MTRRKRVRHSSEEMYRLIASWEGSGEGKAAFCQSCGIPVYVFDYWRRKQAKDKEQASAAVVGFKEIKRPHPSAGHEGACIRLHYPDGRILEFTSAPSVDFLREVLTW